MFPFFKQRDQNDCGPSCLRMLLRYHKRDSSLQVLKELCQTASTGTSVTSLTAACKKIGFVAVAVKSVLDGHEHDYVELRNACLPAIAYWHPGHFVIVYKVHGDRVFVADPAQGRCRLPAAAFKDGFYGKGQHGTLILLEKSAGLFDPDNPYLVQKNPSMLLAFIKKYVFPNKRLATTLFTVLLLNMVLQLALPFLTQRIFDNGILAKNQSFLNQLFLIQIFIFILVSIIGYFQNIIINKLSQKINYALIKDFILKIFRLPVGKYGQKDLSDFMQRLTDHSKLESFLSNNLMTYALAVISIVTYSIILAFYKLEIMALYLFSSVVYMAWMLYINRDRRSQNFERFKLQTQNHHLLYELVEGLQEIKLNNSHDKRIVAWEKIQQAYYENNLRDIRTTQRQSIGTGLINRLSYVAVSFYTAYLVTKGGMSLGTMAAIQFIVTQLNSPLMTLLNSYNAVQEVRFSLERIAEIQQQREEEEGQEPVPDAVAQVAAIRLKNVSFSYTDTGKAVLQGIDAAFERGRTTAIVGASGSGKSTLMKLLLGFHAPTSGSIQVEGRPIEALRKQQWRQLCGTVLHDSYLFTDSIFSNITESDPCPDYERYREAVAMAAIDDFIESLPQKHHTSIGKGGLALSSGQRQRVLLARVFYKQPQYLFLDEATNALDTLTEKSINRHIEEQLRGRTLIVIAHRLQAIRHADKILVLQQGRITEVGTHPELLEKKGHYFALFNEQARDFSQKQS